MQWNGKSNGTPVWLWNCTLNEAQTWQYDRQTGEIFHPASGKCLDVQNASLTAGTRLQIWSCNGTDAQRWTWDPETRVVQNALGTVLDVENRIVAKRSLTVAWERTQTASQQWWFPDVWDALARCFANGTCG